MPVSVGTNLRFRNSCYYHIIFDKQLPRNMKNQAKTFLAYMILFIMKNGVSKFIVCCEKCDVIVSALTGHNNKKLSKCLMNFQIFITSVDSVTNIFFDTMAKLIGVKLHSKIVSNPVKSIKTVSKADKVPIIFNVLSSELSFLAQLYHFAYSSHCNSTMPTNSTFLLNNSTRHNFIPSVFDKVQVKRRNMLKDVCTHCTTKNNVVSCLRADDFSGCRHVCQIYKTGCKAVLNFKCFQIESEETRDHNSFLEKHFKNIFNALSPVYFLDGLSTFHEAIVIDYDDCIFAECRPQIVRLCQRDEIIIADSRRLII